MREGLVHRLLPVLAAVVEAASCAPSDSLVRDPETNTIVLRNVELEVRDYVETVDVRELRDMPRYVQQEVTLVELPIEPILTSALRRFTELESSGRESLTPATRNLWQALWIEPCSPVDVYAQTSLEAVMACAHAFFEPSCMIADLFERAPGEPLLSVERLGPAITTGLVSSYVPWDEHGRIVSGTDGEPALRVTLGDLLDGLAGLEHDIGPRGEHPGIVEKIHDARLIRESDFAVTVRIDANVLPFDGIDLDRAERAKVDSLGLQIEGIFDRSREDWMLIEGVRDRPMLDLSILIPDDAQSERPWTIQQIAREAGRALSANASRTCAYWAGQGQCAPSSLPSPVVGSPEFNCSGIDVSTQTSRCGGRVDPDCALRASLSDNTLVLDFSEDKDVQGDCTPPPPLDVGELVGELTDARLHDGGLAATEADVRLELEAVEFGLDGTQLANLARDHLGQNPVLLRGLVQQLIGSTRGEADFYYVHVDDPQAPDVGEDWLFFVADYEIVRNADGTRSRQYATPGFFYDRALAERASSLVEVQGDREHEKVRIHPGDPPLFVADDEQRIYRIDVLDKPSRARIELMVTQA